MRDAIFLPVRNFNPGNRLNANAWSMRQRYASSGISWESTEQSGARRKAAGRTKDEALTAGLLQRAGQTGLLLTDAGELRAAELCSQFVLFDGLCVYHAIKRRMDAGVYDVWEDDLIPSLPSWTKDWDLDRRGRLVLLQDLLLPWMVRGLVDGASTALANVRYTLGRPLPAGFDPDALDEGDPQAGSGEARAIYVRALDGERERLATMPLLDTGEIGPVPLAQCATGQSQVEGWKLSAAMAARGE